MKKISRIFLLVVFAILGACHENEKNGYNKVIQFESGAKLKTPQGMQAQLEGNIVEMKIPGESIQLKMFELKQNAETALKTISQTLALPEEVNQEMNQPSTDWDMFKINVYFVEKDIVYLMAKQLGEYTWVSYVRCTAATFEKLHTKIALFSESLEVPNRKELNLSQLEPVSLVTKQKTLESFITSAMKKAKVPGVSIAVIENKKLVYSKAFGQIGLENKNPVTNKTQFMIGSTSKPLTTFMLGKLVEQGKLNWEDKVTDLYPKFVVANKELQNSMTLKDLVSASTGMPRRDLPLLLNHYGRTAEEMIQDMKYLDQTTPKGEMFQYNNQLVGAAGFIAAKTVYPDLSMQEGYERLMEELVFKPMSMNRSTTKMENVSINHCFPSSKNLEGELKNIDLAHEHFAEYVAPSGGVWSTAEDLAQFAITELSEGNHANQGAILAKEQIHYRRTPQVSIAKNVSYGLGWILNKEKGLEAVQHAGTTIGFASHFIFFPEIGNGIVVLTNSRQGNYIHVQIAIKILELWYGKDLKSKESLKSTLDIVKTQENLFQKSLVTVPESIGRQAIGEFSNEEIGEIKINREDLDYAIEIAGRKYPLTGYKDPSGVTKLIITGNNPVVGLMFEVVEKDQDITLKLERAQEVYYLTKIN